MRLHARVIRICMYVYERFALCLTSVATFPSVPWDKTREAELTRRESVRSKYTYTRDARKKKRKRRIPAQEEDKETERW